jgi:hypothetical protein
MGFRSEIPRAGAILIMPVLHTSQDVLLALGRRTREEAEGEE